MFAMSINNNLIEYVGLSKNLPNSFKIFKKSSESFNIKIPITKLPIKYINKIVVNISILETKLINTGIGKSLEGLFLTGKKLLCYGYINYKIYYISIHENQNIQIFNAKQQFVKSVIVPNNLEKNSILPTSIFIDDITCILLNENELLVYTSFIISCD
ncbi:MAG: hypothetical protein ACRCTZ_03395 [Sarcina sp.]